MALLRETAGFPEIFAIAASDLRDPAAFLEKDYWVTQVLRALHETAPGGFVLKGGTSLSKGYGIINRFSEDVDLLIAANAGEGQRAAAKRLEAIAKDVAGRIGLTWEQARDPGFGKHPSRGDYLRYPAAHASGFAATINTDAILFETRIAEGDTPTEMCQISALIGGWSGMDPAEFDDLAPFRIRVLEPRRTLIEKLVAVHHAMSTWSPTTAPSQPRFGRHYYDIHQLLDHTDTVHKLADRVKFGHLLAEIERISAESYGGYTDRPDEGFSESIAFKPGSGTELREWIEESYSRSLTLVAPGADRPSLGRILQRVREKRQLL